MNLQNLVQEGAIYHLSGSALIQTYNTYTNITSLRAGGVYYLSGTSELTVSYNTYIGCGSTFGAVFYMTYAAVLEAFQIRAMFCIAFNSGGVLYSAQSSQYSIDASTFQSNRAIVEGSVIYTSSQELSLSVINSITESDIIENTSLQHIMSLHYTRVVIQNCTILRNYPIAGTSAGIELLSATAYLRNTVMSNEGVEQFTGQQFMALGLIYVQRFGGFVATNCTFSHSRAEIGAVLFSLGYSNIEFYDCTFSHMESIVMGGLFFSNYVGLMVFDNCIITDSSTYVGALFFNQFSNNITISNTRFQHNLSPSLFDLTFTNITFYNSTFDLNLSPAAALIQCVRCVKLQAYYNTFSSLLVSSIFKLDDVYADQYYAFSLSNNYFFNITSFTSGGAINVQSIPQLTIQQNVFNLTVVTDGKGGAIMSSGNSMSIQVSQNTFFLCMAREGGALMWEGSEPAGVLNNFYIQNSAIEYGNNYATTPNRLSFVNETIASIYGATLQSQASNLAQADPKTITINQDITELSVSSFRSSGTLQPVYIAVLDQYNQIVRTVSGSLYFYLSSSIDTTLTDFRAQSNYEATNGIFNLHNVRLFNKPESTLTLSFEAILSSPSMIFTSSLELVVDIRNCIVGEALWGDGSCTQCSSGKFLIELSNQPQVCQECLPNADCYGGAMLAPSPGYWRPSNTSLEIYECYVRSACLGSPDPAIDGIESYSAIGTCHPNYEGRLCAQCKDGFTRNSHFQCSKCPQPWKNYLILATLVVVASVLFILLVKATLASSNKEKSVFTVFFKILVNHIQLMALLASFEYDWPQQISSFFDLVKPMADVSSELFSFDCFISYSGFSLFPRFYFRVLLFILLPIILIGLSLIIWSIRYPCSKFPQIARSRTIATTFLFLFFMHPTISNLVFLCFLCRTIQGQRYLVADLSEKCWSISHHHLLFASTAAVAGFFVWVIGVPLIAWRSLSSVKHKLHTQEVKEKYGFLYNGFKNQAYFWESVIMFRKIAIIFVSAILSVWGSIIQAYVLLLVLTTFTVLTVRIRPYKKRDLNHLQFLSLICSLISSYTGLYFITSELHSSQSNSSRNYKLSSSLQWIFFSVIICSNIYFLVMWIRLFLKSLSASLRKKYPRVYFVCVACCQKNRQIQDQEDHKRSQVQEEYLLILDHISSKIDRIKAKLSSGTNFVSRGNLRPQLTVLKHQADKVNLTHLPQEIDQIEGTPGAKMSKQSEDTLSNMIEHDSQAEIVPVFYDEIELTKTSKVGRKTRNNQIEFTTKPRLRRNTQILGSYEIPSQEYTNFEDFERRVVFRVAPFMKQDSDPTDRTTDSSSSLDMKFQKIQRRKSLRKPTEQEEVKQEPIVEDFGELNEPVDVMFEYRSQSNDDQTKETFQDKIDAVFEKEKSLPVRRKKFQKRETFGTENSFQNMEDILNDLNREDQPKKLKRGALKYRKNSN